MPIDYSSVVGTSQSQSSPTSIDYSPIINSGQPQSTPQPNQSVSQSYDPSDPFLAQHLQNGYPVPPVSPYDAIHSAKAIATGLTYGTQVIGSTYDKMIGKLTNMFNGSESAPSFNIGNSTVTGSTPNSITQDQFNKDAKTYQNDPDANLHPVLAGLGNMVGQGLTAAPAVAAATAALPFGASGAIAGGATIALQGMIQGGLTNYQGNDPESTWNGPAAKAGAMIGGITGVPVGAISKYMAGTSQMENAYTNLNKTVNGIPLDYQQDLQAAIKARTDTSDWVGQGMIKTGLNAVGVPPSVTSMLSPGSATKDLANQATASYLNKYANAIAGQDLTSLDGKLAVYNQVQTGLTNTQRALKINVNQAIDDVFTSASNTPQPTASGVLSAGAPSKLMVPFSSQTQEALQNVIQNSPEYVRDSLDRLQQMATGNSSSLPQLMGKDGILKEIYPADILNAQKNPNIQVPVQDSNAATDMMNLYKSVKTDIANNLEGTPAEAPLHNFYQQSENYYDFQGSTGMSKAVMDAGEAKKGFNTFFNTLMNGSNGPDWEKVAMNYVGQPANNGVKGLSLANAIQSSTDPMTNQVDLSAMIKILNNPTKLGQQVLNQQSNDFVKGALGYIQQVTDNTKATLPVLGWLSSNAWLRNAIINRNRFLGQPEAIQYFSGIVDRNAAKAGIIFNTNNTANIQGAQSQYQPQTPQTPIGPVSMAKPISTQEGQGIVPPGWKPSTAPDNSNDEDTGLTNRMYSMLKIKNNIG